MGHSTVTLDISLFPLVRIDLAGPVLTGQGVEQLIFALDKMTNRGRPPLLVDASSVTQWLSASQLATPTEWRLNNRALGEVLCVVEAVVRRSVTQRQAWRFGHWLRPASHAIAAFTKQQHAIDHCVIILPATANRIPPPSRCKSGVRGPADGITSYIRAGQYGQRRNLKPNTLRELAAKNCRIFSLYRTPKPRFGLGIAAQCSIDMIIIPRGRHLFGCTRVGHIVPQTTAEL